MRKAVRMRSLSVVTGIVLFANWGAAPAAQALDWTMLDFRCQADLVVPCGPLGYLHFGNIQGCGPYNSTSPPHYGRSQLCAPSDIDLVPGFFGDPKSPGGQPIDTGSLPNASCPNGTGPLPFGDHTESGDRGYRVLDWEGWHGRTIVRLINELALPDAAVLRPLNDPSFADVLGESVTDAHVTAGLCQVLDETQNGSDPYPLGVYLGIGRQPENGSECSEEPNHSTLSGWIAEALFELRNRNVPPIAAAGNYGDLLFPACREDALAVGSEDLDYDGKPQGVWETPSDEEVRGLSPGQSLDITGVLSPPGSSYAGAFLAGCYANHRLFNLKSEVDLPASNWLIEPGNSEGSLTFSDGKVLLECNETASAEIVDCIRTGGCKGGESQRSFSLLPADSPIEAVPSLAEWVSCIHLPQPEDPFCIPCAGRPEGGDMIVDRSYLIPRHETPIAETYLRIGDLFWQLSGNLETFRGVTLEGAMDYLEDEQPSLVIVWAPEEQSECPNSDLNYNRYWTSAPIQMDTWQP